MHRSPESKRIIWARREAELELVVTTHACRLRTTPPRVHHSSLTHMPHAQIMIGPTATCGDRQDWHVGDLKLAETACHRLNSPTEQEHCPGPPTPTASRHTQTPELAQRAAEMPEQRTEELTYAEFQRAQDYGTDKEHSELLSMTPSRESERVRRRVGWLCNAT